VRPGWVVDKFLEVGSGKSRIWLVTAWFLPGGRLVLTRWVRGWCVIRSSVGGRTSQHPHHLIGGKGFLYGR
jgi:hypothetical protein